MLKINFTRVVTMLSVLVVGCGGAGGQVPAQQTSPKATTTVVSGVAITILAAEASGKLPVLNRDNTLLGVDADGNGVRDDIDAYINALPDTPAQKKALRQNYKATAATLIVDIANQVDLDAVSQMETNAVHCAVLVYGENFDIPIEKIDKFILNTKIRYLTYQKYNKALNGSVATLPKVDTCEK